MKSSIYYCQISLKYELPREILKNAKQNKFKIY